MNHASRLTAALELACCVLRNRPSPNPPGLRLPMIMIYIMCPITRLQRGTQKWSPESRLNMCFDLKKKVLIIQQNDDKLFGE